MMDEPSNDVPEGTTKRGMSTPAVKHKKLAVKMAKKKMNDSTIKYRASVSKNVNYLNTSVQKQTLRLNNLALARNLAKTRQELRTTRESLQECLSQNQTLTLEVTRLRRIAGLQDDQIEAELQKRVKETMLSLQKMLQDLTQSMDISGRCISKMYDTCIVSTVYSQQNNSRGSSLDRSSLGCSGAGVVSTGTVAGVSNPPARIRRCVFEDGTVEGTTGNLDGFVPTTDMSMILEQTIVDDTEPLSTVATLPPVQESHTTVDVPTMKTSVVALPKRVPAPSTEKETVDAITEHSVTSTRSKKAKKVEEKETKTMTVASKTTGGASKLPTKLPITPAPDVKTSLELSEPTKPSTTRSKHSKSQVKHTDAMEHSEDTRSGSNTDSNCKSTKTSTKDRKDKQSRSAGLEGKQIIPSSGTHGNSKTEMTEEGSEINVKYKGTLLEVDADVSAFGFGGDFATELVSGSPISSGKHEKHTQSTLPAKSTKTAAAVDEQKKITNSKKDSFKVPSVPINQKKDNSKNKGSSQSSLLKDKSLKLKLHKQGADKSAVKLNTANKEKGLPVRKAPAYDAVTDPFKPTMCLLRSPPYGGTTPPLTPQNGVPATNVHNEKPLALDDQPILASFKRSLDAMPVDRSPLPQPMFEDEQTTYFNTDMEFTTVMDTASFLSSLGSNKSNASKSNTTVTTKSNTCMASNSKSDISKSTRTFDEANIGQEPNASDFPSDRARHKATIDKQESRSKPTRSKSSSRLPKTVSDKEKVSGVESEHGKVRRTSSSSSNTESENAGKDDPEAAVELRTLKPGVFSFKVGRKEADGTRKPVPENVRKSRSKKRRAVTPEPEEERRTGSDRDAFNFGDRTPTMPIDKMPKSVSQVYDLSMNESVNIESLKKAAGNRKTMGNKVEGETKAKEQKPDEHVYYLPLKGGSPDEKKEARSKSRTRSKSGSRKNDSDEEEWLPGAGSRSKSRARSRGRSVGKKKVEAVEAGIDDADHEVEAVSSGRRGRSKSRSRKVADETESVTGQSYENLNNDNYEIDKAEGVTVVSRSRGRSKSRSRKISDAKSDEIESHDAVKKVGTSKANDEEELEEGRHRNVTKSRSRSRKTFTIEINDEKHEETSEKGNELEMEKMAKRTRSRSRARKTVEGDSDEIELIDDVKAVAVEDNGSEINRDSRARSAKKRTTYYVDSADSEDLDYGSGKKNTDSSDSENYIENIEKEIQKRNSKSVNKLSLNFRRMSSKVVTEIEAGSKERRSQVVHDVNVISDNEKDIEKHNIGKRKSVRKSRKVEKPASPETVRDKVDTDKSYNHDNLTETRENMSQHSEKDILDDTNDSDVFRVRGVTCRARRRIPSDSDDVSIKSGDVLGAEPVPMSSKMSKRTEELKGTESSEVQASSRPGTPEVTVGDGMEKSSKKSCRKRTQKEETTTAKSTKKSRSKIVMDEEVDTKCSKKESPSVSDKTPACSTGRALKSSKKTRTVLKSTTKRRSGIAGETPILKKETATSTSKKSTTQHKSVGGLASLKRQLTLIASMSTEEGHDRPPAKKPLEDIPVETNSEGLGSRRNKKPVSYKIVPLNKKLRQGDQVFGGEQPMSKVKAEQSRLAIARKSFVPKISRDDKENCTVVQ